MLARELPARLFGLELQTWSSPISTRIPRVHAEAFHIYEARLGDDGVSFFLAVAQEPPTIARAHALRKSLAAVSPSPLAICWDAMDLGMMNALATEGIAYVRDEHNAFLPFMGAVISSRGMTRQPKTLSPQAQRIVLNLVAGRWDRCTAGDLAGLTGKSRASITKYLNEIEAVVPGLVESRGRLRVLTSASYSKDELLRGFDEFLSEPAVKTIRLKHALDVELLRQAGALLTGESALSLVSDLAPAPTVSVAVDEDALASLKIAAGNSWQEASWYDAAEMAVEVWRYPVDAPSDEFAATTGLSSVDALNLYVACSKRNVDDVRYLDAVEQLREEICR